jgi:hypothetical protein
VLPQDLIVDFWLDVQNHLETDHRVGKGAGRKGISDYLALAEKHGFTDLIYHRDPWEVAETIAGAVTQGGFREPNRQHAEEEASPTG